MSEKGGNHIWPAYVDMMTVLLMVYLLLALLFQVVVATSKTAVSQSSQAQQRKEAASKQVTEQKKTSEESPRQDKAESPNAGAKNSASAKSDSLDLVELDPTELKLRDGDFSVMITEAKRNFLAPAEVNLMKKWVEDNRARITDKGVRVFSVAQVNRQVGTVLKVQFDRALSAISVLLAAGIPQDKIVFDNIVVRDVEKDYVALRLQ